MTSPCAGEVTAHQPPGPPAHRGRRRGHARARARLAIGYAVCAVAALVAAILTVVALHGGTHDHAVEVGSLVDEGPVPAGLTLVKAEVPQPRRNDPTAARHWPA